MIEGMRRVDVTLPDYTWQPAKELYADVPDLVTEFLASFKKKKKLVAVVKRHLGISS